LELKTYLYIVNHLRRKNNNTINYKVNEKLQTVTLDQVMTLKDNVKIDQMYIGLTYDIIFLLIVIGLLVLIQMN
jgi:hypothetical protein